MRLILVLIVLSAGGTAFAADVPPTLTVAKLDGAYLQMELIKEVPVSKEMLVTRIVNGVPVTAKVNATVYETTVIRQPITLKGAKITSGGKVLSEKALAEALANDTPVVTSFGPVAEKYKKLFKDDAIFIEFPAKPVAPPPPK